MWAHGKYGVWEYCRLFFGFSVNEIIERHTYDEKRKALAAVPQVQADSAVEIMKELDSLLVRSTLPCPD